MFRFVNYGFGVLVMALFVLGGCATAGKGSGEATNQIKGRVLGMNDTVEEPVGSARVSMQLQQGRYEQLVGVAITNQSGQFAITRLVDRVTGAETELIENQEYIATVIAPGYYVLRVPFEYTRGSESWEFVILDKDMDTLDKSAAPTPLSGLEGEVLGDCCYGTVRRN